MVAIKHGLSFAECIYARKRSASEHITGRLFSRQKTRRRIVAFDVTGICSRIGRKKFQRFFKYRARYMEPRRPRSRRFFRFSLVKFSFRERFARRTEFPVTVRCRYPTGRDTEMLFESSFLLDFLTEQDFSFASNRDNDMGR